MQPHMLSTSRIAVTRANTLVASTCQCDLNLIHKHLEAKVSLSPRLGKKGLGGDGRAAVGNTNASTRNQLLYASSTSIPAVQLQPSVTDQDTDQLTNRPAGRAKIRNFRPTSSTLVADRWSFALLQPQSSHTIASSHPSHPSLPRKVTCIMDGFFFRFKKRVGKRFTGCILQPLWQDYWVHG